MISHRLENSRRGDLVSVSRRDELLDNLSARNVTAVFRLGEKLLGHRQLFRYNSRRMSRAEKLFDKLTAGRNDANFSFDDLCTLLTKLGYNARKTKGSHSFFTRVELLESATQHRRKGEILSGTASTARVAKIESQTMMKNTDAT